MNEIKLIIFDWDDVFTIGASEGYYACYQAALESVGVNPDLDKMTSIVRELWGRPHELVIATLLKTNPELVERANKAYEKFRFSEKFLGQLKLVPGSIELLNRLKQNYSLAIATGISPILLKEQLIPLFNIPPVFSEILANEDLADRSRGKPFPDLLLQILDKLKYSPSETIMVGDGPGDVKMAQASGVTPVVVLTGQLDKKTAERLGVKYILNDVTELETILK